MRNPIESPDPVDSGRETLPRRPHTINRCLSDRGTCSATGSDICTDRRLTGCGLEHPIFHGKPQRAPGRGGQGRLVADAGRESDRRRAESGKCRPGHCVLRVIAPCVVTWLGGMPH